MIKCLIFSIALFVGIAAPRFENRIEFGSHECTNWSRDTLSRPLFTLDEGKQLLGRKVRFNNSILYPQNKGRIGFLEMVAQDKFLIMIDWEIDPAEGKEKLLLYDKEALEHLEFEN